MQGGNGDSDLVWSTDPSRRPAGAGKGALGSTRARGGAGKALEQPGVRKHLPKGPCVSLETAGRKGKGVTLVTGLALPPSALETLGKELRNACGSGGTAKDGVIEVQGDHRDKVQQFLAGRGIAARRL